MTTSRSTKKWSKPRAPLKTSPKYRSRKVTIMSKSKTFSRSSLIKIKKDSKQLPNRRKNKKFRNFINPFNKSNLRQQRTNKYHLAPRKKHQRRHLNSVWRNLTPKITKNILTTMDKTLKKKLKNTNILLKNQTPVRISNQRIKIQGRTQFKRKNILSIQIKFLQIKFKKTLKISPQFLNPLNLNLKTHLKRQSKQKFLSEQITVSVNLQSLFRKVCQEKV